MIWQERDRWFLWLPVAFASGIGLYFALPSEPSLWLGPLAALAAFGVMAAWRSHPWGWVIPLAVGVMALGFARANWHTQEVAAPVLAAPTGLVTLEGTIEQVEIRDDGWRLILTGLHWPPLRRDQTPPTRIRVTLRPATVALLPPGGLMAGQVIRLRAMLFPPPPPSQPGSHDFTRQAWFKGLGAVGLAPGPPERLETAADTGWRVTLEQFRQHLTSRIMTAMEQAGLPDGTGAIAAALLTGATGPVPEDLLQSYRDAGLAHVLVIAGLHLSMVAGLVFMLVRVGLAFCPAVALRWSSKKLAAAVSFLVITGYLLLSGAPVPTQRAWLMNGLVLGAILLEREAISLRSLALAALLVLAVAPEILVGPSFQMSFAAVVALIAGYEVLGPKMTAWRRDHPGWPGGLLHHLAGVLLTTQIAGTATAFYTIAHFNRYAVWSLLGNLLALPLVGVWIMPCALLAMLLYPLGLDGWIWPLMGAGIAVMNKIATTVSGLPLATLNLPAVPTSALVLYSLGGAWLCLWRRRWRLFGLAGIAAGLLLYALHRSPDVLIDGGGKVVAVRDDAGQLHPLAGRGGQRVREAWSRSDGQGPDAEPEDAETADPRLACDSLGCRWSAKGHLLALAKFPEALEEDCFAADIVVVRVPVRLHCPSARLLIDGTALRRRGTHALWLDQTGAVRVETVADWQGDRPWRPVAWRADVRGGALSGPASPLMGVPGEDSGLPPGRGVGDGSP